MYKLFLCLKYLRKRALAYLAMLGVALCVWMLVVCVSVLNGFVDKIERAAKGLFGDIVISSPTLGGLSHYDEFSRQMRRDVPAVEGASPFILTFGILRVPGTDYRRTVQIAGIRLPERAEVSDFEEGLFVQEGLAKPTFDPPMDLVLRRLYEERQATEDILERVSATAGAQTSSADVKRLAGTILGLLFWLLFVGTFVWVGYDSWSNRIPTGWEDYSSEHTVYWLLFCVLIWIGAFPYYLIKRLRVLRERKDAAAGRSLITAVGFGVFALVLAAASGRLVLFALGQQELQEDASLPNRIRNALSYQDLAITNFGLAKLNRRDLEHLRKLLAEADDAGNDAEVERLEKHIARLERFVILPPERRMILGLGIAGLTSRTRQGETIRTIGPGQQVVLSLIPMGRRLSYADVTPSTQSFTVIDDCSTDVASIDSEIVYVNFQTLQKLNNMSAEPDADDPNLVAPARCSQIHVKVDPALSRGRALQDIARQIQNLWDRFAASHPDAAGSSVRVETWRERQSRLVSSIEAQRTLMVIILGILSVVAVVLIFVIMYVIVVQKTRDIGVLKAVGASSWGVAGIFLAYGAAIGLVGSVLGTIAGWLVVKNINPIHDWVGRAFGLVVWSRETFMFELIPNEVELTTVLTIVVGAIASGVLGSVFPAAVAAVKQPVEALRYE